MGAFAADVANLSRIVTLHNLSIAPVSAKDTSGNLAMEATARTYRYLDAAEVAAQQKAAAEKAAKAAGAKK
jgi:type IV pilus assembly protein PilO